ncbi:MAG: hypothetical protein WC428_00035 [Candidatus Paceibacterota bacterium]|jgi:hypothetical protein
MKFKALRKKETKEFVEIQEFGGMNVVFTSELPNPQPLTATIDLMKQVYVGKFPADFNFDDYELVEFETFEINTVGSDIRNKLSPPLNLVSLLRIYFTETGDRLFDENSKAKILPFIKKEMDNAEKSIKYIANLL